MKTNNLRRIAVGCVLGLAAGALGRPAPVQAATYVVNTTDQRWDLGDWPCTADHCSLWEAVVSANVHPGPDRITFNIPGDGPKIIYLGDPVSLGRTYQELNVWDDDTEIDATTQPGWPIYLHGLGEAGWGMIVHSNRNAIRGLGFLGFIEAGIAVFGNANFLDRLVVGDYLGEGLIPAPILNEKGIYLYGNDNTMRGVQVGNNSLGISSKGTGTTVQDSRVGTLVDGSSRMGNGIGIEYDTSAVGGTIERNTILGNEYGIFIGSGGNTIVRNYIGMDPLTGIAYGNGTGICLENSAGINIVGGTDLYEGNVVVDNGVGITIAGIAQVLNNRIGLDFSGRAIPNETGVYFYLSSDGSVLGSGYYGAGNVIANNTGDGVFVNSAEQIAIEYNTIYNNGGHGISLFLDTRYEELPGEGMRVRIRGNSIYGNGGLGINIPDPAYANDVEAPTGLRYTGGAVRGTACTGCRVEVFVAAPDPTGFGEGKRFLDNGTAGSEGSFSIPVSELRACDEITATATDALGNTSAFSRNANASLCFRVRVVWVWAVLLGAGGAGAGAALLLVTRRRPLAPRQLPWLFLGAVLGIGLGVLLLYLPFVEVIWPLPGSQSPPGQPQIYTPPLSSETPTVAITQPPSFIPTLALTTTSTVSTPTATLLQNANCRRGAGTDFDVVANLPQGLNVPIVGRNPDGSWWQVQVPGTQTRCWVAGENAETSGGTSGVPEVESPTLGCWVWTGNKNECKVPCPEGAQPGGPCEP
jgi:parallel beta-helix repeat protein